MGRLTMATWVWAAALAGTGGLVSANAFGAEVGTETKQPRTGGCFCGTVRYEITGSMLPWVKPVAKPN